MRLQGKVAVVTGGTRGLGKVIAERFVDEGCTVVCSARNTITPPGPGSANGRTAFKQSDVRVAASVRALMAWTHETYGSLDIVVANAGIGRPGPVASLSADDWDEVMATNLGGAFHCMQAAVPYLERSSTGCLINVSSVLASHVLPGAAAYCSSKTAVEMLTKVCAIELADRGIRVNCLSPGFIDEGMGRKLASVEHVWSRYSPKLAMGRMGDPREVADAAVFLAGDESAYVNGHVLEVSGGLRW